MKPISCQRPTSVKSIVRSPSVVRVELEPRRVAEADEHAVEPHGTKAPGPDPRRDEVIEQVVRRLRDGDARDAARRFDADARLDDVAELAVVERRRQLGQVPRDLLKRSELRRHRARRGRGTRPTERAADDAVRLPALDAARDAVLLAVLVAVDRPFADAFAHGDLGVVLFLVLVVVLPEFLLYRPLLRWLHDLGR